MLKECRKAQMAGISATVLLAFAQGCGKPAVVVEPPRPVTIAIDVKASASVNPDAEGRPSPIMVRVYQLVDGAALAKANLNDLWADDTKVLAASLVSRQEFELAPGGSAQGSMTLESATRQVAVAAAFRDFRGATWRVMQATPQPPVPGTELVLAVALDARSVSARLQPATKPGAVN
jgi:type VI secretion system protein VasD